MINPLKLEYKANKRRNVLFILAFALLALVSFFITLGFGVYDISLVLSLIHI